MHSIINVRSMYTYKQEEAIAIGLVCKPSVGVTKMKKERASQSASYRNTIARCSSIPTRFLKSFFSLIFFS